MSVSLRQIGAITLFVDDRDRATEFYGRAFDAPLVFEDENSAVFKFEESVVNLLVRSQAAALVAPAAVAEHGAGAGLQLTIWVENADEACAALAERGVELLNGPLDRPWGMRTAAFTDPDGHVWEVAQELG